MIALGLFLLRLARRLLGLRQEEIEIAGTSIVYSIGGQGEPLLLLHGLGASRATFDATSATLIRHYRVLIPDLPGFGESGLAPDGDYGIDAQVEWVERFVESIGLSSFHLGGNSMGGWIAAAYAAKYSQRVKSLWLLAAAGTEEMLETEAVKARQESGDYLLLSRTIAEFDANSAVKKAEGEARAKSINAEADARVVDLLGQAEAGKTLAIGEAEAEVINRKIASMESGNYAMVQVAEALAKAGVKLVPDVIAGGGAGQGTLVDVLLAGLIKDKVAL